MRIIIIEEQKIILESFLNTAYSSLIKYLE